MPACLAPAHCHAVQGLPDHALQWFKVPLVTISSFSWREGEGSTVKEQGSAIIKRTENSYKTAGLSKHGGPCRGEDRGSHEDLGSKLSVILIFVMKPSLQAGL